MNEDIMTGLMAGKRGLIMGLANDKSLAWGIAKRLHAEGAELAFSYQGEVMEKRVRPLAAQLDCDFLIDCDVADMANLDRAFETLAEKWPTIDFVVHAIGFTNKEALRGKYYDVGLEDFLLTMNVSVYSFTAVAKRAAAMMKPLDPETGEGGGSMLTLSYYGAEKVMPHYNVMGVAKAALEAAVLDAQLRANNISLASHLGSINELIPSGVSVGIANSIDELVKTVGGYLDEGYARIKLKIEPGSDIEHVAAVRAELRYFWGCISRVTGHPGA